MAVGRAARRRVPVFRDEILRCGRGEVKKNFFFSFLFVGATVSFLGGSALHEFDAALPLRSNGVTTVASSVFFSRFRGRKREDDAAGVGARAVPVKKRGGRRGEEEEVVLVVVVLWGRSRAFDAAGVTTIVRRTWVKSRRPIRNHLCGACLFRSLLLLLLLLLDFSFFSIVSARRRTGTRVSFRPVRSSFVPYSPCFGPRFFRHG